ncbi:MAG: hypothetical protein IJ474_01275 [Mailhella sp.]|nr:hypothetical protein [Mailhella sp.]MBQ8664398.1 hypothetical protein [Mailhella sp.]MBQ8743819.1 hypothetical protein [Mailhella sp.]MBQ9105667.1 hypothetical protein [Mailhella sp.]
MRPTIELPDWLEARRPDDSLYADAYESTPAELRALLKTAIAFSFHRWTNMDGEKREMRSCSRSGFCHSENSRSADWVLAVLGSGFASPARLLAALIPAIIAGTGRILIVSEAPFTPSICTALELAGLEDSFVMEGDCLHGLYEDLRSLSPDGRIAFFANADGSISSAQKTLMHAAALDGIPRLRDLPAPRILSLHGAGSEAEKRLFWLHPDAEIFREAAPGLRTAFVPDAAACPRNAATSAPFICGPGMEACWPGPSPEFYRTSSCSAFLFQENDPETLP